MKTLLFFFFFSSAVFAGCENKQSLDSFLSITSNHSPQADGKGGVYFISDLRDSPQVFHLEKAKAWPVQVSFFPDGVVYYKVSPDYQKILVGTHQGGDEQYDVYLYEKATRVMEPLLVGKKKRIESVFWKPDSSGFAFTSNERNQTDFDLYSFDLKSKTPTKLAELKGLNSLSDYSWDGKKLLLVNYRSINDSSILLYETASKNVSVFLDGKGEVAYGSPWFSKDAKAVFYLSDAKEGLQELYRKNIQGNKEAAKLTQEKATIEELQTDPKHSQMLVIFNRDGYSDPQILSLDAAGNVQGKKKLSSVKEQIIRGSDFDASGRLFYSSTDSVTSTEVFQVTEGKPVRWSESNHAQVQPQCFQKAEKVEYSSFDGRKIPSFIYFPRGKEKKPIPFIIMFHGGPESQYRPNFSRVFQYFLQNGYGIFAPNVRGSSGYGREYLQLDDYKKRMDSVQDGVWGARWLVEKGYTEAKKIIAYGGSYGGFMVLRTIQVAPELFGAASENVGITNFVTFLENTKPYRRALREVEYGPLADRDFLKSISPMTYLSDLKTPLLILHGENDPRVPVSEAEQLIEALKKKDVPVEAKIFKGEGHGNAKMKNIMEQAVLMSAFFDKFVK